ncbi:acid phosphatase-domain-containing protein [Crepidotus variabilis]|uniref:Acid phosphatase-domain-containing protein n=1 Tax=Crepidotus variabilis TaxID=179855 RepID=A0A9P6EA61_9AGAR|nr:acid phosphatase-domain-containing protein [Crepidotus variabilis]
MSYPKIVAFDTDWTIWKSFLDAAELGKGSNSAPKLEDNIARADRWLLRDKSLALPSLTPDLINDVLKNNAKLAIVSRNPNKALCDRALYYYNTIIPKDDKEWSIIDMVSYDEVVDGRWHFRRIMGWSGSDYSDMLMFDDEAFNNVVKIELGTAFQLVRDKKALTWELYQEGLDAWRRAKKITIPSNVTTPPRRALIGYTGLNKFWIDLVNKREGVVDRTTSYRWGYGLYVADNLGIAKMYHNMEKDIGKDSSVCAVYVKDYDTWARMNKIWVPENTEKPPQMNSGTWFAEETGRNQEDRDAIIAERWGVRTPYALFSRHFWFNRLPIPEGQQRWSEMLLSRQIVRALIEITLLSDDQTLKAGTSPIFQNSVKEWNITVPDGTRKEFLKREEKELYQLMA